MSTELTTAIHAGRLWRGAGGAVHARAPVPTGYPELDAVLGGGWPPGQLLELLVAPAGQGELGLMLPALAAVSQASAAQAVLLLEPPYVPYAPALVQRGVNLARWLVIPAAGAGTQGRGKRAAADEGSLLYWAMEEALASGACSAVVAWGGPAGRSMLQRLQGAAGRGGGLAFLVRPPRCRTERSPAALRLRLDARCFPGMRIEILRNRFGRAGVLDLSDSVPATAGHTG